MINSLMLKKWLLCLFLCPILLGCDGRQQHPTATEALRDFPAGLSDDAFANLTILHQEETPQNDDVPEGIVLVYLVPQDNAETDALQSCVMSTFVSKQRRGWRAESSGGGIGCGRALPQTDSLRLGGMVGGNITPLGAAYGLLPDNVTRDGITVLWADGVTTVAQVNGNLFFDARWETVLPVEVEYRLMDGEVVSAEY